MSETYILSEASTPAPKPKTNAKTERQRDYCKKLCSVVAHYLTADELTALVQTLETFKGSILKQRYAPGLNDATYELFANFHLRGPAVGQAGKVVP